MGVATNCKAPPAVRGAGSRGGSWRTGVGGAGGGGEEETPGWEHEQHQYLREEQLASLLPGYL